VTVDGQGNAIAVWENPYGIQASIRPAGGHWLAQPTLTPPGEAEPPGAEEPQVASDAAGDAIAAWPSEVADNSGALGHSTGIQTALSVPGEPFSAPQRISRIEDAWHPHIVMNAEGDAVVTWEDYGSRPHSHDVACVLRAASRRADGAWSSPRTLSGYGEGCEGDNSVAIDANGGAIVVWDSERPSSGYDYVESAELGGDGQWSPRHVLARSVGIEELSPAQVAMDAPGDAIVVWTETVLAGGGPGIRSRFRPAGGRWGPARKVPHSLEGDSALAMDARGDAFTLWEGKRGVEVAARTPGGRWRTSKVFAGPHHDASDSRTSLGSFEAAIDTRGNAVISWWGERGMTTVWRPSLFP
jgi:hypothetical protein